MSTKPKDPNSPTNGQTNWSAELHAINTRRQDRTISEHEKERQHLLDVIDEVRQQLDVALAITESEPHATRLKVDHKCDGEATAFAVASDWHVEETVDPKTINGLNEFNLDIAEQRIAKFFKNVVRLTEIQRKGTKIERLVLFLGGDLMTGYIHEELQEGNALSPTQTVIWLQDRIASGLELLGKNFSEIVVPCSFGNHGRCHDPETELLTRRGWLRHNQLVLGELVATYNLETGAAEWQPLDDIYVDHYEGDMICVKHASADFMVTPKHRMVLRDYHSNKPEFREMETLGENSIGCKFFPKLSSNFKQDWPDISDDELCLFGWLWTDGNISNQGKIPVFHISQSKPEGKRKIEDVLSRLGYKYSTYNRHRPPPVIKGVQCKSSLPETTYYIYAEHSPRLAAIMSNRNSLPEWVWNISKRQFDVLFESICDGDGGGSRNHTEIHGRKDRLDQLQALLQMNGYSPRMRVSNRGDHCLSVRVSPRGYINNWDKSVVRVPYNGTIWCGTVANGAMITRRNGIPLISGNTTKKPRHATGAANSYEWMLYKTLQKYLNTKATWMVSDGYHLLLDLYGKTIRLHHGDNMKYQGGIGGLTIPVEKAIAAWNKSLTADLDVFGHWHQSQQAPKWVCNGSIIGHNAYAVAIKAAFEPPSQTFFLFDKKHGRTITAPVFVQ